MCGFIGLVSSNLNIKKAYNVLQKLNHRGPDEEGVFSENNVFFGHKRLVVVDKRYGKQPYSFNNYNMIYNGELYNTDELKQDLISKGYTFTGHSDTEVLLKLYAEYKENCPKMLNGIFAFVIWDNLNKELFACRDNVGVKPMYYYHKNEELMISSEMKTILKYYDINEIKIEGLQEILGLGPSHTPGVTVYKNVYELRPGHYLKYKDNILSIQRYWQVKAEEHRDDFETTVSNVRFLLEDSIKRQLISDVPLCTYLSGGLDSTAITLIGKKYKPDLETYSIDYIDNDKYFQKNNFQVSQDNEFIKLVVDRFKLKHHYCIINNQQLADTLNNALYLRDQPGMADIDSSLYWFSKQIKPNFTVALSGECADEIFGGYPWFYNNIKLTTFPWLVDLDKRNNLLNDNYQKKLKLSEYVNERFLESLRETPLLGNENDEEIKQKQMSYLNMNWFMTTLLDRKDRMTMGASLEVRVPFADYRIIEYLYNIPWEMKYHNNVEKGLLREALKDIVPMEILTRKKNPYPKTHNPVFTKIVTELLKSRLTNKNSILYEIFNEKALLSLLDENNESFNRPWFGQLMTRPQLIAYLYQFDMWFNEYNLNIVE